MAINVTIARGYAWRMIIIGVACLLFGAWGVYDYVVDIPRRQQGHERYALLERCRDALETEQAGAMTPQTQEVMNAVTAQMNQFISRELGEPLNAPGTALTQQQQAETKRKIAQAMGASEDADWFALMIDIGQGLAADRGLPLTKDAYPVAHAALEATKTALNEIGQVTAPGKYDRVTQWGFIACLPCAVYFFWVYFVTRRRKYALDDEGTLHTPAGAWKADEIADIDMSRWMAKSIAWPVHDGGGRVKLDDYKFQGLHRIVGAIASRLYPQQWDRDAKPVEQAEAPADPDASDRGDNAEGFSESAAGADAR